MIFDHLGIIFVKPLKPLSWVLIRIASPEAILMSTHNLGFYEDLTKIIIQLSSNTYLIYSADNVFCLLPYFIQFSRFNIYQIRYFVVQKCEIFCVILFMDISQVWHLSCNLNVIIMFSNWNFNPNVHSAIYLKSPFHV